MGNRQDVWAAVRIENHGGGHGKNTRVYVDDVDVSAALSDVQVTFGIHDVVRVKLTVSHPGLIVAADRALVEAMFPKRPLLERLGLRLKRDA